ncbi:TRAP transporter, 4TM/12TM fusion protein [Dethiosulfovibrio peptidovorans DSM 11002]|uniref:TRAP transporter, 4TM/12TM fusion protein n=1 Tax=Dethiosulfovibrio peptidovorans DSM 11002 TaxID=469381 RepID=D2Z802_9BACT|nr:TRAP transporter permease [Dethiosulfovibrio peptidovorans]EFC91599.1 TRAP transporter, 4TM/12TM fusion protein [Dethiosulfovibrio peptidovorans DSM 11002]
MRKLQGTTAKLFYLYVLAMGFFHLYTALFGTYEAYLQRAIHLTWVLPMAFILYPIGGKKEGQELTDNSIPWYDWILAAASLAPGIYIMANYTDITYRMAQVDPVTTAQLILGSLLTVLLLEATRRVVGLPLALIAAFFTAYMYYGNYMPGIMKGLSFSFHEVIEQIYLIDEGIFSIPLGVSATFVMIFLIFGGFLEKSGVGAYFMEFAQAFTGTSPGGPAKIAVVSSALFGSISGAAVANVYGTGTFTIPLMKRIGYPPFFAGAVEAVASTGGQIMPPIMGAGAFIMASFLGEQFRTIMIAAVLPALLYYSAVLLMVHLGALKNNLKGLSPEDLPDKKVVIKKLYMMSPIAVLIYLLLTGYTPMLAAVIGIGAAWLVSMPNKETRMGPKAILDAVYTGAKNIPVVCIACAAAGLVVGSVSLTGIGFKFVGLVFSLANGAPFIALILIALVSLVLGMGLPTTSAYILGAALGVPALAKLGFDPLAAHMFVFYFAIVSNITPPVALAAYAASSIADASPNKTGFQAMKLGILAFIIPFAFCYDQGLLLSAGLTNNVISVLGGIGALFSMGYSMLAYTNHRIHQWQRAVFLVVGVACLWPMFTVKIAGVIATIVFGWLWRAKIIN